MPHPSAEGVVGLLVVGLLRVLCVPDVLFVLCVVCVPCVVWSGAVSDQCLHLKEECVKHSPYSLVSLDAGGQLANRGVLVGSNTKTARD